MTASSILPTLLLIFLSGILATRKVHIQIRENITQSCPNVDSNLIDEESLKISMKMLKNNEINNNNNYEEEDDDEKDEVTITDVNGETKKIDFPGCYRVKISFRMLKPIENPYIEAFMQLGQNVPCSNDEHSTNQNLHGVESICANISQPNHWCPESFHTELRQMLGDKKTCKFCQLCENVKEVEAGNSKLNKIKKYLTNEGSNKCSTNDNIHRYSFKMCTPTRDDLNHEESATKEKIEEYWEYLKQGIMTTVIHVMDRSPMKLGRSEQCQKMCKTLENSKQLTNSSYKQTLKKSIEKLCSPEDTYAACLYHTVKFDVNTDFKK